MLTTKQFRQDIQLYFGSRGRIRRHRTGFFSDLNNPEKLGLFFCVQSKEELDQIRQLLSKIGKERDHTYAMVFFQGSGSLDVITNKSIFMFSLDDFNLFGKKKEPLQLKFEKERFDLLISFTFQPMPFCKRLVSEIHADFKIGPDHEDGEALYDILISVSDQALGLSSYYNEVVRYLGMLNVSNG
ncbi:MAG: hypothetical protein P8100_06985 [bacterium]